MDESSGDSTAQKSRLDLEGKRYVVPKDYRCSDCGAGTMEVRNADWTVWMTGCACRYEKIEQRRRAGTKAVSTSRIGRCHLPHRFLEFLGGEKIDKPLVASVAQDMAERPGDAIGFVLLGNVGTGKTFSGAYVLTEWIRAGVWPCRYFSMPELASDRDWRKRFAKEYRLVHLDDIGYQPSRYYDRVFGIVDHLYRSNVPVIYTSSQTEEGIRNSLGDGETAEAVIDRLHSYPLVIFGREESLRVAGA